GVGNVKVSFMGIMGFSNIAIHGTSTVTWGMQRMRVALAFDTTGSMNDDGKMAAAKTAAKGLVDQMKAASKTNGDIYVSLVPFSRDVNVSKLQATCVSSTVLEAVSWMRWDLWEQVNGSCSQSGNWWNPLNT